MPRSRDAGRTAETPLTSGCSLRSPIASRGNGRSFTQKLGAAILPQIESGRTPIHVRISGVAGRALAFRYSRTLSINNANQPSVAADRLGPVHFGRYEMDLRFDGDAKRLPVTLKHTEVMRGSGGC